MQFSPFLGKEYSESEIVEQLNERANPPAMLGRIV